MRTPPSSFTAPSAAATAAAFVAGLTLGSITGTLAELPGLLILISLFAILVLKLNFGIDFQGGALLEYENRASLTTDEVRAELADLPFGVASVTGLVALLAGRSRA